MELSILNSPLALLGPRLVSPGYFTMYSIAVTTVPIFLTTTYRDLKKMGRFFILQLNFVQTLLIITKKI